MASESARAWIVFGNQLFTHPERERRLLYLAEDVELCTRFRQHKHKLVLFLAAMRRYAEEMRQAGHEVHYVPLEPATRKLSYEEKLGKFVRARKVKKLDVFEIEDKFMEQRLTEFCEKHGIALHVHESPMFVTSRQDFAGFLRRQKRPFMKTFYEWQRQRLDVLMTKRGEPRGGHYSFDTENRKRLPKTVSLVPPPRFERTPEVSAVLKLVEELFSKHPGSVDNFWLPTSRAEAEAWLDDFIEHRLAQFGPYQDAITRKHDFVYHSLLSPMLNLGLLTPKYVLDRVLEAAEEHEVPLNSLEGFVRQLIGWREFVRGIYQKFSEVQSKRNFFGHERRLNDEWYTANTGLAPLDHVIGKANQFGYIHHIERLMIAGNLMLLCEIHPHDAHRWFMEMFVDSSDWVMGPNVYGMGIFSDGGIFATKPYVAGSNYVRKMSDIGAGDWCDVHDGLFWSFIHKHRTFFDKNARLSRMTGNLDRMDAAKKRRLFKLAREFRERVTV